MYFIKKGLNFNQVNKLNIISLIIHLGLAAVGTIWAIYFESLFHNPSTVGFIMTIFAICGAIAFVGSVPTIEKKSKTRIFSTILILFAISYLLFSVVSSVWILVILGAILSIIGSIRVNVFGIILRDKSKNNLVSKNVSLIYTFINIAWLIGPIIAGFVSERYGIRAVFLGAAIAMFFAFLLLKIFRIRDERINERTDDKPLKLIFQFLKSRDRRLIYIISGGITFWWTLTFIYMPMYIVESGFGEITVGYFLALIIIPLISLEYYFGKIAAKKGFKKIFFIGYALLAISSFICFFLTNIYFILATLIIGTIGMAMLEPTTEAYFFDLIKREDRDRYYGPYNTAIDLVATISVFVIAVFLRFFEFKSAFIITGIFMIFFAFSSLRIKNILESRRS